jgi:signal transduction histidine kinase
LLYRTTGHNRGLNMKTEVSSAPDVIRHVGAGVIDTQRKPVTYALLGAAVFFLILGGKNLLDRDYVTAGLCGIAVAVALAYAHAIHCGRPQPLADGVLTTIALCVVAVTIERRGLVGVLWCPPVMLMLHLVTNPRASATFDIGAVLIAVPMTYAQINGVTAFRIGAILVISSAFAHIYARIMASHQARQEEQRQHLDLMVSCANVGGLEWDDKTLHMRCSPRLLAMLGNPPNTDRPDWNILDWVHPQDRARMVDDFFNVLQNNLQPGEVRKTLAHGFRFVSVQGDTVWVHAEAIAVGGESGTAQKFIATFLDITQLRAAEADTLAALKRQTELNELRARFLAMASHEFRTPLAAILSSAELLKQYDERLSVQDRADLLTSVETGVHRMAAMLDRILLVNKADAQMLDFKPEYLDVQKLSASIAEDLRAQSQAKECSIDLAFTGGDPMGHFDPKLMHHIFGNLLSNAIKYSPHNSPVVFRIRREEDHFAFDVCDHGIGIPAVDLPELFEPFHRGSNVADIKGTGLGLTIVKKSVELHRGQIAVESEPGRGTCFHVTLLSDNPSAG